MKDFIRIRVAHTAQQAGIGQCSLQRVILSRKRIAKRVEIAGQDLDSSLVHRAQSCFTAQDVQGRAPLRAGFGEHERTIRKVERGETLAAHQFGVWRAPVQPASNHQMQNQPKIIFHSDCDTLADSPQFAHRPSLNIRKRRLCRSKQKGAGQTHLLQPMSYNAWFKSVNVGDDIRQLGHSLKGCTSRLGFRNLTTWVIRHTQACLTDTDRPAGNRRATVDPGICGLVWVARVGEKNSNAPAYRVALTEIAYSLNLAESRVPGVVLFSSTRTTAVPRSS